MLRPPPSPTLFPYTTLFRSDGASALATHLSNLHITPIEILESEFPCRITAFELVPDSGGAGEFRGGLSFRRSYERSEEHTSELQSLRHLVCRLLLEKKSIQT